MYPSIHQSEFFQLNYHSHGGPQNKFVLNSLITVRLYFLENYLNPRHSSPQNGFHINSLLIRTHTISIHLTLKSFSFVFFFCGCLTAKRLVVRKFRIFKSRGHCHVNRIVHVRATLVPPRLCIIFCLALCMTVHLFRLFQLSRRLSKTVFVLYFVLRTSFLYYFFDLWRRCYLYINVFIFVSSPFASRFGSIPDTGVLFLTLLRDAVRRNFLKFSAFHRKTKV